MSRNKLFYVIYFAVITEFSNCEGTQKISFRDPMGAIQEGTCVMCVEQYIEGVRKCLDLGMMRRIHTYNVKEDTFHSLRNC